MPCMFTHISRHLHKHHMHIPSKALFPAAGTSTATSQDMVNVFVRQSNCSVEIISHNPRPRPTTAPHCHTTPHHHHQTQCLVPLYMPQPLYYSPSTCVAHHDVRGGASMRSKLIRRSGSCCKRAPTTYNITSSSLLPTSLCHKPSTVNIKANARSSDLAQDSRRGIQKHFQHHSPLSLSKFKPPHTALQRIWLL